MVRLGCVLFASVWLAILYKTQANQSPWNKRTRTARSDDTEDFVQDTLNAHNLYRQVHGVPPLMISKILNVRAQKWADQLAVEDSMVHDPDTQYGENLHMFWSSNPNAKPRGREKSQYIAWACFRNACEMDSEEQCSALTPTDESWLTETKLAVPSIEGSLSIDNVLLYVLGAEKAVDDWYSEIKMYDFNRPHFSSATGHFTQVVWKGTSELGIGIAQSQISKRWYTVAKYSPRGNYLGQFAKNVLRPSTVN